MDLSTSDSFQASLLWQSFDKNTKPSTLSRYTTNRSIEKLSNAKSLQNSPIFSTSPSVNSMLNGLQARIPSRMTLRRRLKKQNQQSTNISVDIAVGVIQKFLLPFFKQRQTKSQSKLYNMRSPNETFSLRKTLKSVQNEYKSQQLFTKIQALPNTIFGELEISVKLYSQLLKVRRQLLQAKQRLTDSQQQRKQMQYQKSMLKQRNKSVNKQIQVLKDSYVINTQTFIQNQLQLNFIEIQEKEYKNLIKTVNKDKRICEYFLHEEMALNDKRRNNTARNGNIFYMLTTENELILEKLELLRPSLIKLLRNPDVGLRQIYEVNTLALTLQALANSMRNLKLLQLQQVDEETEFKIDESNITNLLNEFKDYRKKLLDVFQSSSKILNNDFAFIQEQNEFYDNSIKSLTKESHSLHLELQNIRKKLNSLTLLSKGLNPTDELICANCSKLYIERYNYNWSCRIHMGIYSAISSQWWCCGKKGQNALGCKIDRHHARKDEEVKDNNSSDDESGGLTKYGKCSVIFNQSCRGKGHKYKSCPKDPNVRSNEGLFDELIRIENISNKINGNEDALEKLRQLMVKLEQKCGNIGFGLDLVSSIDDDADIQTPDINIHDAFQDVTQTKIRARDKQANVIFTQDYIKIQELQTQEEVRQSRRLGTKEIKVFEQLYE